MEAEVRKSSRYTTYGSLAYVPEFDGPAVRQPRRREAPRTKPTVRPREQPRARPKAAVREQGSISLFAVAGFLAAAVFAALVLYTCVQITVVGDETVALQSRISALQSDRARLLAQYELAYDLQGMEEAVLADGSMCKPRADQIYVLTLCEEDSVTHFQREEPVTGAAGALNGIREIAGAILEYFR